MSTAEVSPVPRRRIRDPELHRRAILDAAALAFTERGYGKATIRDIARRAGVTHGLVLRHFGSKEQLFLAAVPGTNRVADLLNESDEPLGARIAKEFIRRMEDDARTDTLIALIRSAAEDEQAASVLYVAMQEHTSDTYRQLLGNHALEHRVPFIAALLVGVTFGRYIIGAGSLADMTRAQFTEALTATIGALLQ